MVEIAVGLTLVLIMFALVISHDRKAAESLSQEYPDSIPDPAPSISVIKPV